MISEELQVLPINRKQRIKNNLTYSSWEESLFRVPQGSVFGPLLFNTFLLDLFWIMCKIDFASYEDDNIPYVLRGGIYDINKPLEDDSINLFEWFLDNQIKANSNKCHLITSKQSCINLKIGNINIKNSTCKKLLVVKIDNKHNFNEHLDGITKKASHKVSVLTGIFPFTDLTKRRF